MISEEVYELAYKYYVKELIKSTPVIVTYQTFKSYIKEDNFSIKKVINTIRIQKLKTLK